MTIKELIEQHGQDEAEFVSVFKGKAMYHIEEFSLLFELSFGYKDELERIETVDRLSGFDDFEIIK